MYFILFVIFGIKISFVNLIPLRAFSPGDSICITLNIGEYTSDEVFEVNMATDVMWVRDPEYMEEEDISVSLVKTKISPFSDEIQNIAVKMTGPVFINSECPIVPEYSLYYIENWTTFEAFPLCFAFKNLENSLTHVLFDMGVVDKRGFFISANPVLVDLGGPPSEVIDAYRYREKCEVLKGFKTWGCQLNYILLNNSTVYNNSYYAYFQAATRHFYFPVEFYRKFSEEVLERLFNDKICEWNLECDCGRLKRYQIDDIVFVFEDNMIRVDKSALFDWEKKCTLLVRETSEDLFVIGMKIFNIYPMYFDYDEETITFYSKRSIEKFKANEDQPKNKYSGLNCGLIKIIYEIINGVCCTGILLVISKIYK